MLKLILSICFFVVTGYIAVAGDKDEGIRHNLCDKIRDTLHHCHVRHYVVYKYKGLPVKDTSHIKVLKERTAKFISALQDSSNYLESGISKSCAFIPEYYFKIVISKKQPLYILFSATCGQLAIVDKSFKKVAAFGDLNDKGADIIKVFTGS